MEIIKKFRLSRPQQAQETVAASPVDNSAEQVQNPQAPAAHEPLSPYAKTKKELEEFKLIDWYERGKISGLQLQSTPQICEDEVNGITYAFIHHYMAVYKELLALTPGADIDAINEGNQGERAAIARVNREYLEKELARCKQQIEMEHVSDPWSECNFMIRAYKNGFEAGSRIRLRNNGLYY